MKSKELRLIKTYFNEKLKIYSHLNIKNIHKLFEQIKKTYLKDGNVYIMGNGGTTGIAEGFAVDLRTHPFVSDDKSKTTKKRRIKVICLTESSGALTGISNDIGFNYIFSEQLKNFLRNRKNNDLLIALSSSGNSQNMIEAIKFSKKYKVTTSSISGRGGGKASKLVDIPIVVPGNPSIFPGQRGKNDNNFHIEDIQNSISHILVGLFKEYVQKS